MLLQLHAIHRKDYRDPCLGYVWTEDSGGGDLFLFSKLRKL